MAVHSYDRIVKETTRGRSLLRNLATRMATVPHIKWATISRTFVKMRIRTCSPVLLILGSLALTLITARTQHSQPEAAVHVEAAQKFANAGDWKNAETEFRRAIDLQSRDPELHASLGLALTNQKKLVEAEAAFRQAVLIEPKNPQWHTILGVNLSSQRKYDDAEKELIQAVKLEPANALWHANLGLLYQNQEKWSGAQSEFEEAVRLDPKNAEYQKYISEVLDAKAKKIPSAPPTVARLWTKKVEVNARNKWTSTEIYIKQGDTISIKADGMVYVDSNRGDNSAITSEPNGIARMPDLNGQVPTEPLGALIAVIGNNNDIIRIGSGAQFTAKREGLLMLGVNKGLGRYMTGSYTANIEVRR